MDIGLESKGKELLIVGLILMVAGFFLCWPIAIIGVILAVVGGVYMAQSTGAQAPPQYGYTPPPPQYYPPPGAQPQQYPPPSQYAPPPQVPAQPQYGPPGSAPQAQQQQPPPQATQQGMPQYCARCGSQLSPMGTFCPKCGHGR